MPSDMPNEDQKKSALRRFIDAPPDTVAKTIVVAVSLCLVASLVVSAAAVSLRPIQEINAARDKQVNILQVAGIYEPGIDVGEAFAAFEPHVLDLNAGTFTEDFDATTFDDLAAAEDPELSRALEEDPAGIGRQSNFVTVYLLREDDGALDKVIMPVHGYGLWSTLYGFIALEEDGNEIFGLQFYQHGETPGLGAEVDNPRWKAQWNGKQVFADGEVAISVAKSVPPQGPDYHVDALAGATLTSVGVDNLVKFWLGEEGYTPFLTRLREGGV